MITRTWGLRVYGEPAPKGSMVCNRDPNHSMREQVGRGRAWRKAIEKAAPEFIKERAGDQQPLRVTMAFTITRLAAAADREFPSTQSAKGTGGDADKMARLVLDALQSCGVLRNDAQAVRLVIDQFYPGTEWIDDGQLLRPGMQLLVGPRRPLPTPPPELPYEVTLDADERSGR